MMNNFGMNPMLMNPMIMNNFGMMGMNNQQNLMDENAIRIKNIIQPYENKIKELEEIIRQKDFEIALLKDKLNNNGINIQSQNFININPINQMNMMMPISNLENSKRGKEIIVYLMNNVNNITKQYSCFENDMTYILFDKMYQNHPWNLLRHYLEGKKIYPFLKIAENGIKDGSIINVNLAKNVIFREDNGSSISIALDENFPIKKAIKYYLLRKGKEGCFNEFSFIYDAKRLNIEDKNPIKNIFKYDLNPNVRVEEKIKK